MNCIYYTKLGLCQCVLLGRSTEGRDSILLKGSARVNYTYQRSSDPALALDVGLSMIHSSTVAIVPCLCQCVVTGSKEKSNTTIRTHTDNPSYKKEHTLTTVWFNVKHIELEVTLST